MASTTVPEIAYRFLAENADALKKNEEVEDSLKKINKVSLLDVDLSVNKLLTSVKGLLPALSAAAVAGFANSALQAASAVGTAAERAQLAVGEFGRLQYVASQADVNFDELTGALKQYRAGLDEAASGQGNLRVGLDRLNLSAADLRNLGIEQQLSIISDRFREVTDPTTRAAIAQDIFGKSGQALIPLLMRGGEEIKRLAAEAERLGLVFNERAAVGADRFYKALDRLQQAAKVRVGGALGNLFADIFGTGDELADTEARLNRLKGLADSFLKNPNPATTALLAPTLAAIAELTKRLETLQAQANQYGTGSDLPFDRWRRDLVEDSIQPFTPTVQKIKEEDELIKAIRERAEQEELERENRRIDRAVDFRQKMETAVIESERRITEETEKEILRRADTEEYARQVTRDREKETQKIITDFRRATVNAAVTMLTAYSGKYKNVAKAILAIEKAQAIAETVMATKVAATKAFQHYGPTPAGYAAAAAMIAYGALQVAAIASTVIGGASSTAGSPHNPVFVSSGADASDTGGDAIGSAAPAEQRTLQVIINGNVYSGKETIDFIFNELRDRINEYDSVLINPTSRQARELIPENTTA